MCKIFISRWPKKEDQIAIRKQRRPWINISNRKGNVPYERLCFRETSQLANETVEQFVTRLRLKTQTGEFGDAATVDEQIRDQVISKCLSHELRRKLLQKGRNLTLPQLREIARSMEESEKQARSIEGGSGEVRSEVNTVKTRVWGPWILEVRLNRFLYFGVFFAITGWLGS